MRLPLAARPRRKLAIARLLAETGGSQPRQGTAFAVTDRFALTAFHCVGDRRTGDLAEGIVLRFQGADIEATPIAHDVMGDWAVLRLRTSLPRHLTPVPLAADCHRVELWYSVGFPVSVPEVNGYAVAGKVTQPDTRILDDVAAIQLHCEQAAARLPLAGLSGAPVLAGEPEVAVGIIRWNAELDDQPDLAAGAAVFACPVAALPARATGLDRAVRRSHRAAYSRSGTMERRLMDHLPLARAGRLGRRLSTVAAATVVAVLLLGGGTVAATAAAVSSRHHGSGQGSGPNSAIGPGTGSGTAGSPGTTNAPSPTPAATSTAIPTSSVPGRPPAAGTPPANATQEPTSDPTRPPNSAPVSLPVTHPGTTTGGTASATASGPTLLGVGANASPRGGTVSCGQDDTIVFTAEIAARTATTITYVWRPDDRVGLPPRGGTLTFPAAQTKHVTFDVPRDGQPGQALRGSVMFEVQSPSADRTIVGDQYDLTCESTPGAVAVSPGPP
jgi:Trypsin-like peptidase domain